MSIGEVLIWESSNLLLLIPVVIGLVMYFKILNIFWKFSSYRLFNHTYSQNKPITTMATINIVRSVLFISNAL